MGICSRQASRLCRPLRRCLRRASRLALDLLYPSFCPACAAPSSGGRPCPACLGRLRSPRPPPCPRCGRSAGIAAEPGAVCPGCRERPWFGGRVAAPFLYSETGGALVRALKFRRDAGAGLFLGRAMARAARAAGLPLGPQALLVPVPLHPRKLRRRGIHQAFELARAVGARTRTPVCEALQRTRETQAQGLVGRGTRSANVAGAFAPARPARRGALLGRMVVLVDDVATSGATARECRRVLREGGAASVDLLAACLAGPGP